VSRQDHPSTAHGRLRLPLALGLACSASIALGALLLRDESSPVGATASSIVPATGNPLRATLTADAAPAPAPLPLPLPVRRPSPEGHAMAAVCDDPPIASARPDSERAFLEAFLHAAREPGADPVALADRSLQPEVPVAAQLAALRGLVKLQPAGLAKCLGRAQRDAAAPEVREVALRHLCDFAVADAAARGELLALLQAPAASEADALVRRRAASTLAGVSPPDELSALAAALAAERDETLLAGVSASLAGNPKADTLPPIFPSLVTSPRGAEP